MGFKYVCVPAEEHRPMVELEFNGPASLENDHFITELKKHFGRNTSDVDRDVLLKNLAEHSKKDVKELKSEMDPSMMESLMQLQALDIFPVMLPHPSSNYYSISLYCDDKGVSKDLPINKRASSMVETAGYSGQIFRGDIFFSRVYDNEEEEWKRVDFTLADCSSDAEWIKLCQVQRKGVDPNKQMQSLSNLTQKAAGADGEKGVVHVNGATDGQQNTTNNYEWTTNDVYKWRQKPATTTREVTGAIEIIFHEEGLTKKDINVMYKSQHLKVTLQGKVVFDNALSNKIIPDDCVWTLTDKKQLEISLEPMNESGVKWAKLCETDEL